MPQTDIIQAAIFSFLSCSTKTTPDNEADHLDSNDSETSRFNEPPSYDIRTISERKPFAGFSRNEIEGSNSVCDELKCDAIPVKMEMEDEQSISMTPSMIGLTNEACERSNLLKAADEDDSLRLFFDSLAKTVRTFPPTLRAKVKAKVFHIVNDAEISLYT